MDFYFDEFNRFVIENYASRRPFSSFLPGIAGPHGVPMWAFYVNRGQAIASFGIESKDKPILEFQPANKAYQTTPFTGFRTFIKIYTESAASQAARFDFYEPFAGLQPDSACCQRMAIGLNELELSEINPELGLRISVLYFIVPGENFPALARQVTLTNTASQPIAGEVLDGLPVVVPCGVGHWFLKEMSRTVEAWMSVFNLEAGVPFYRVHASIADTAEVEEFQAGYFYLAFTDPLPASPIGRTPMGDGLAKGGVLLPAIVDPRLVFSQDTSLSLPQGFLQRPLVELLQQRQVASGQTPCGFFGAPFNLGEGESITLSALVGYARSVEIANGLRGRLTQPGYLREKRIEASRLTADLSNTVSTHTGLVLFDAYCQQNFLDNVLRGGWPVCLGSSEKPFIYHIYSRRHGDLERDYNAFFQAAEPYSQGNGAYRDVNQNRRCDVMLNPQVGNFDIVSFVNLIQADGYNPLVIRGSRFTAPLARRAGLLALTGSPEILESILARPFTPGELLKFIADHDLPLEIAPAEFLKRVLTEAEQHFEADPGEGYWIDHWTYNLDLIEAYLAIYPERKDALLHDEPVYTFYDNPHIVCPRAEKYVLVGSGVRQLNAVAEDEQKAALIATRSESPHLMRSDHGRGEVYRTTLFVKLVSLAMIKFATLDPWGMGIEMEAGKPGWYDALNGLPALFGSSIPESYELQRLLEFLLAAMKEKGQCSAELPLEVHELLVKIAAHLRAFTASKRPERDFEYWDAVASEREAYRKRICLGFDGLCKLISFGELAGILQAFLAKVQAGITRAVELNGGFPPTYFTFDVEAYEILQDAQGQELTDGQGRSRVRATRFQPRALPAFLEGPVHALKLQKSPEAARQLYQQVKSSPLFDAKLKMYKVNASLADQPAAIGRARAFTPGWLENESIWLHMEFKYLLEMLKAGLYEEFFQELPHALPPFLDPKVYGRSPLENSSFIVSSAHPDESLHGGGFVARLSGSTAEFLSIWHMMMAGLQPFVVREGQLCLSLRPILPGWLFTEEGALSFQFLGNCMVTYHNPGRLDTFGRSDQSKTIAPSGRKSTPEPPDAGCAQPRRPAGTNGGADGGANAGANRDLPGLAVTRNTLHLADGSTVEIPGGLIGAPYADMARRGLVTAIHVEFALKGGAA